jgi:hypothetical protein
MAIWYIFSQFWYHAPTKYLATLSTTLSQKPYFGTLAILGSVEMSAIASGQGIIEPSRSKELSSFSSEA